MCLKTLIDNYLQPLYFKESAVVAVAVIAVALVDILFV
jgi:hypothetical protein